MPQKKSSQYTLVWSRSRLPCQDSVPIAAQLVKNTKETRDALDLSVPCRLLHVSLTLKNKDAKGKDDWGEWFDGLYILSATHFWNFVINGRAGEEQRLRDDSYQDKMAHAILGGVKRYFAQNPALSKPRLAQSE